MFSSKRNKSGGPTKKVANLTIQNEFGNNLIDKFARLIINREVGNDLFDKVAKMTINDIGKNSNGENAIGVQAQFVGYPSGISHQN